MAFSVLAPTLFWPPRTSIVWSIYAGLSPFCSLFFTLSYFMRKVKLHSKEKTSRDSIDLTGNKTLQKYPTEKAHTKCSSPFLCREYIICMCFFCLVLWFIRCRLLFLAYSFCLGSKLHASRRERTKNKKITVTAICNSSSSNQRINQRTNQQMSKKIRR